MTRVFIAALLLSGGALAMAPVLAQTAAKPPAKPAAPKARAKTPAKPAAKPAKPAEPVLPTADVDQVAAATLVLYGDYACEFNQTVKVVGNAKHVGYVDVDYGKLRYVMKPVLSSTGALRLEDVYGKAMMLQISYKSMLMDVQAGRRMVDDCVHEKQAAAKKAAEGQPPAQALLMAPPPAGSAPAAAAPSTPSTAAAAPAASPAASSPSTESPSAASAPASAPLAAPPASR